MFKLQKSPTFTTTATLDVPTDSGVEKQTLTVRFRLMPDDATEMNAPEFLRGAILHLSDIADDDGEQLAFSDDVLDKIIALPFARVGLIRAYWQAMAGAKLGN